MVLPLETYIEQNKQSFENDLCELLRIPSVSTDSAFKNDVQQAGNWIADRLKSIGFETELIDTVGHPIVFAQSPPVENAPTVLVYGHYDVQPPDPLDEWETPPFEPSVRDGNLFARGATDDKGQVLTHIFSAQAWKETSEHLPVQIKFLIEGEEECGSKGLWEFLAGKYDQPGQPTAMEKIQCDVVVISDGSMYGPDRPAITYGLKGISYFELRLQGPNQDLHSGAFGGSVTNPANALTQMLAQLIDENGRVQIPGFYDNVLEMTSAEREQFASLGFDDQEYMDQIGVDALSGEEGFTTLERRWSRPTFDINGLWSGYQDEGAKTVLPAKAGAKFSCRLVANQDPEKIANSLEAFLNDICPRGIEMELVRMHGARGVTIDLDSPYMAAAAEAIERGFGTKPCFIRTGGSIPVVTAFSEKLGVDTLLLGWGQDDDNMHSPNEKFSLSDFHRGIKASAHLWAELAEIRV